jgi:hypothetical protein
MQKIRVTRTFLEREVAIGIRFKALSQFLDADDPTPLPDQELTEFAEETIAGYVDEYRPKHPVKLMLEVPGKELPTGGEVLIPEAVKNHFSFRLPDLEHELILSRREGFYSFIIATFNAMLAVIFFTAYYDEYVAGNLIFVLLIGLITVLNWVTIWDTYEYFMYDYRNLSRKRKIYQKITRIPVTVAGYSLE